MNGGLSFHRQWHQPSSSLSFHWLPINFSGFIGNINRVPIKVQRHLCFIKRGLDVSPMITNLWH
uniref:Uncharacterized protein n=1 Tax=Rhizophora mucronata TaxID=61149 RepID=A0A2P2P768_RHIMU